AWRVRWNTNTDTPLPPDEAAGQNPPDGAIIHYYLATAAADPVTLEIRDAGGRVVRRFSSTEKPEPIRDERQVPRYWFRPSTILSARAGLHRLVWDLHYPPPGALEFAAPIAAVFQNTWKEPRGPWALPGAYTIKLTVAGRSVTQPLTLKMDPRIRTPATGLHKQFAISMRLKEGLDRDRAAIDELRALRRELA